MARLTSIFETRGKKPSRNKLQVILFTKKLVACQPYISSHLPPLPSPIADLRGLLYMTSANFSDFWTPSPLVTVSNQLILFLLLFWDPLPPNHCGRHIWKPPLLGTIFSPRSANRVLYIGDLVARPSSEPSLVLSLPLAKTIGSIWLWPPTTAARPTDPFPRATLGASFMDGDGRRRRKARGGEFHF